MPPPEMMGAPSSGALPAPHMLHSDGGAGGMKVEEEIAVAPTELFDTGAQCTVTGGVLDELTAASYSFENDAPHSEVLLF